ncbi:hypothetical protein NONO_c08710 [Nocardia nova SH22a]|uniref:Uncharacterized protein n=2 Tax=Nocardia nova TaxID=37330 RepID=W5T9J9_9NOCA|nr:hypothetical protein NONO_c08710 [Nocardia nova SH22a]
MLRPSDSDHDALSFDNPPVRVCEDFDRCAWKAAAFRTLVGAGHLAPQSVSPRERAAARGIRLQPPGGEHFPNGHPRIRALPDVLDRLPDPTPDPDTADAKPPWS